MNPVIVFVAHLSFKKTKVRCKREYSENDSELVDEMVKKKVSRELRRGVVSAPVKYGSHFTTKVRAREGAEPGSQHLDLIKGDIKPVLCRDEN